VGVGLSDHLAAGGCGGCAGLLASAAQGIAQRYPRYASQIAAAAKDSFLHGAHWAFGAGILAVLLGAAPVFLMFPRPSQELTLLVGYQQQDAAPVA
jgi:MFS transporter, DHA2 family, multidrug resistance protein